MGLFDIFRTSDPSAARTEPTVAALPDVPAPRALVGDSFSFSGLGDPLFLEFMRGGLSSMTQAGAAVTIRAAMRNTTVLRCVALISGSISMLPVHLIRQKDRTKATDHPLFRVLHRRANPWQTATQWRSLMQQRVLEDGDAFSMIVRGGQRQVMSLIPMAFDKVEVRQRNDWSLEYVWARPNGAKLVLSQDQVLHLRDPLSEDGVRGLSRVRQAAEAIGLSRQLEAAAARLFRNGTIVGGRLETPNKLSPETYERLQASLDDRRGAENAHRDMVLEEGLKYTPGGASGRDAQSVEQRKHQIEEIARAFGVPRPLVFMDDTSWGSGIDVLGQFFVRYGLNPWFESWQQSAEMSLLSDREADEFEVKFNPGALLRGSMKEQGEFLARALGAGGHAPWMHQDEARDWMDMPPRTDLPAASGQQQPERPSDES